MENEVYMHTDYINIYILLKLLMILFTNTE